MELFDNLAQAIRSLADLGRCSTVFGEPKQVGEVTIIPVARVMVAAGFGGGSGMSMKRRRGMRSAEPPPSPSEAAMDVEAAAPLAPGGGALAKGDVEGQGGGGGARVTVSPVAVIRIKGNELEMLAVVDWNRIAVYLAVVGAVLAFWGGIALARLAQKRR